MNPDIQKLTDEIKALSTAVENEKSEISRLRLRVEELEYGSDKFTSYKPQKVLGLLDVVSGNEIRLNSGPTATSKIRFFFNDGTANTPLYEIYLEENGGSLFIAKTPSGGQVKVGDNLVYVTAPDEVLLQAASGNYILVEPTQTTIQGDTYFVTSGSGLPFGSCYGNEINFAQASAAQDTWYPISDADMTDGQLNLVTHDGSGKLTVSKAGKYLINYSTTLECSSLGKHVQSGIIIDGSAISDGTEHWETATANSQAPMSSTAIVTLAANGTVQIGIRTTDTGTPTLTVDHLNISIVQIGS